jgi:hypothetical protein
MLDRRRFGLLAGEKDASALLAAVEAYRNPDGGYGWGLEPDLRAPESQPGGALHAFEAIDEAAATTPRSTTAACRSRSLSQTRPAARRSGRTPTRRRPRFRSPRT